MLKKKGSFLSAPEDPWGYGGSSAAKNAASPAMIDLDYLSVLQCLWLPGQPGNYVSTPDKNEIDYDSSTMENGVGRWEGVNTNLLSPKQSSFEDGFAGLQAGNCTIETTVEQSLSSTHSLKMTALGGDMRVLLHDTTQDRPYTSVVPNQVYTAIADLRAATTRRQTLIKIAWFTESDAFISEPSGTQGGDHSIGWSQVGSVFQAPSTAAYGRVDVWVLGATAGEVHYLDRVGLFETPTANLVADPAQEHNSGQGRISTPFGAGNVAVVSTEQTYMGRTSLKIVQPNNERWGRIHYGNQGDSPIPMAAGQIFRAVARVYTPTGGAELSFEPTGFGSYTDLGGTVTTVGGSWQTVTRTLRCDVAGAAILNLQGGGVAGGGGAAYVDALQVTVGSVPTEYVPPITVNLQIDPTFLAEGEEPIRWFWQFGYGGRSANRLGDGGYIGPRFYRMGPSTNGDGRIASLSWGMEEMFAENEWTVVSMYVRHVDGPVPVYTLAGVGSPTAQGIQNGWVRVQRAFFGIPNQDEIALVTTDSSITMQITTDVSAIQVERGTVAGPFMDGSLGPGHQWLSPENRVGDNSGFDVGRFDNWNVAAGWEIATWTRRGPHSARYNSAVNGYFFRDVAVIPGEIITASLDHYADVVGAGNNRCRIEWIGATGADATEVINLPTAIGSWKRVILTRLVPAGATTFRLVFHNESAVPHFYYIDSFQVEGRSYATPYWANGTQNQSVSRRQQPWVLGGTSLEFAGGSLTTTGNHPGQRVPQGTKVLYAQMPSIRHQPSVPQYGFGVQLRKQPVEPSTTYAYSGSVLRANSATRLRVLDNTTGAVLGTTEINPGIGYPSFDRPAVVFTTGPNTTSVRLQILENMAPSQGNGAYYSATDAVQLERNSVSPYVLPLRITGDLDVRAHVALEDWTKTSPSEQTIMATWQDKGWLLQVWKDGLLHLAVTDSTGTVTGVDSTAAVPATDGAPLHVRAMLDVDNGAAGRTTRFQTSTDGTTWTQLGADVVTPGAITLYTQNIPVSFRIGTRDGGGSYLSKGKVLSAEVRAGIDGPIVAEVAFTGGDYSREIVASAPVGYWPMTNAPSTVLDATVGPDGVWSGAPDAAASILPRGTTSTNPGGDGAIVTGLNLAGRTAFTLEAWTSYETVAGHATIFGAADFRFQVAQNKARVDFKGGGGIFSPAVEIQGSSVHIAYVRDGNLHTLYVNGRKVASEAPVFPAFDLSTLSIGIDTVAPIGGPDGWAGRLSDLAVYDRALPASEILKHYHTGSGVTLERADTAVDLKGRSWTLNRSGDATAEIVNRNTWAFTGAEFLQMPDRGALNGGNSRTHLMAILSRGGFPSARLVEKGSYGNDGTVSLYLEQGRFHGYLDDRVYSHSAVVTDGRWHLGAQEVSGLNQQLYSDGVSGGVDTHGKTAPLTTPHPLTIGANLNGSEAFRGLGSWVATLDRPLTAAEYAELVTWNNAGAKIINEPSWLRRLAVFYINADDPLQRLAYRDYNRVINLAGQATFKVKVGGTFVGKSTEVLTEAGWVPI